MKVKLSKSGVQNAVKMQSDFLSTLILLSTHHKALLDIEAAMPYPLVPVSLALAMLMEVSGKQKNHPFTKLQCLNWLF